MLCSAMYVKHFLNWYNEIDLFDNNESAYKTTLLLYH